MRFHALLRAFLSVSALAGNCLTDSTQPVVSKELGEPRGKCQLIETLLQDLELPGIVLDVQGYSSTLDPSY